MLAASFVGIAAITAAAFVVSAVAGVLLIALLPRDFFIRPHRPSGHLVRKILKNIAGWLLLLCGLVLSVPGIPGPGIVILIIGLMMVDFPGKHKLQRKLVRRPSVSKSLNRIRSITHKPAFQLPD